MYIRKTTTQVNKVSGASYMSYRLVHGYRNSTGKVKQETLLNLGSEFSIPEEHWRMLTDRIEQLLSGSKLLFELELPVTVEQEAKRIVKILSKRQAVEVKPISQLSTIIDEDKDYQTVDINSLHNSEVRHIGTEIIAYHAATQLNLQSTLFEAGLNKKQVEIALSSVLSRLIAPGSESRTHRYLTQESALDEVMDTEFSKLDIKQLYLASDLLLSNKDMIEEKLYLREKELFNLDEVITLFDITNTYFEGHHDHGGANKGRSKEKRSDCALVSLGLLLDGSGFPKKSKILPGNISEPSTLKDMLSGLDASCGTTVIMDAGIATLDNITHLQDNGYKYIVVKRDADLVMPDKSQVVVKDTERNKVTVSLVNNVHDDTVNLYCHSSAKEAKSIEFINKMSLRFEEELSKLANNLPSCDLYANFSEYHTQSSAVIFANGLVFTNKPTELINLLIKDNNTLLPSEFCLDTELTNLLQQNESTLKLCEEWSGQTKTHSKLQSKLRSLFKLRVQVTKTTATRDVEKVAMRIGRLKQTYKSVAHLYTIDTILDNAKHYTHLHRF